MATTLTTGPMKVQTTSTLTLTRAGAGNVADQTGFSYSSGNLTSGTGAGKCDLRYIAQVTLAGSGTTTLNLSSLTDTFGGAIAFVRIKSIYVENNNGTTATSILVGGGSNPLINYLVGTTPQVRVRNGMVFFLGVCQDATGFAVTASTGDKLLITNEDNTNSATVNIELIGNSA